ncbi:uncharacterized protein [Ptychodera flava]|uniref:uncharacterized protein n=1 Tax=Ptychodera flava TaxID=63121 RepID=UPI00396A5A31
MSWSMLASGNIPKFFNDETVIRKLTDFLGKDECFKNNTVISVCVTDSTVEDDDPDGIERRDFIVKLASSQDMHGQSTERKINFGGLKVDIRMLPCSTDKEEQESEQELGNKTLAEEEKSNLYQRHQTAQTQQSQNMTKKTPAKTSPKLKTVKHVGDVDISFTKKEKTGHQHYLQTHDLQLSMAPKQESSGQKLPLVSRQEEESKPRPAWQSVQSDEPVRDQQRSHKPENQQNYGSKDDKTLHQKSADKRDKITTPEICDKRLQFVNSKLDDGQRVRKGPCDLKKEDNGKLQDRVKIASKTESKVTSSHSLVDFPKSDEVSKKIHASLKVQGDRGKIEFLFRYRSNKLTKFKAGHFKDVEIGKNTNRELGSISVKGEKNKISQIKVALENLMKSVHRRESTIENIGMPRLITMAKYTDFLKVIGDEVSCTIEVINLPDEMITKLNEELSIRLVRGNIAKQKTDVIVNTIEKTCNLTTGAISQAVLKSAGGDIQAEITVKKNAPVKAGDLIITSGSNLHCKVIFHVCILGTPWNDGIAAKKILRNIIKRSLKTAHESKMSSIAIPAIGTGYLGYPKDVAARIIYEEIVKFSKQEPRTPLKEIIVVVYDQDLSTCQAFENEMTRLHDEPSAHHDLDSPKSSKTALVINSHKTPEGKTVTLIKGDIVKEKADVLVNPIHTSCSLGTGKLPQAMLRAAGNGLQTELSKNKPNPVNIGDIISTGGAGLKCKYVYHVCILDKKWDGGSKCEPLMRGAIRNCLTEADNAKMKSIAIPAMGTGGLQYPSKTTAQFTFEEVYKFSASRPSGTLTDIRIVVYDQNPEVCKVYEEVKKAHRHITVVEDIFKSQKEPEPSANKLIGSIGAYCIYRSTIWSFKEANDLPDEAIDATMYLLTKGDKKTLFLESHVMSDIALHGKFHHANEMKLNDFDICLGAVFISDPSGQRRGHWTLLIIDCANGEMYFLDPSGEKKAIINTIKGNFEKLISEKCGRNFVLSVKETKHPLQPNRTSCGVFVIKFAECLYHHGKLGHVDILQDIESDIQKERKDLAIRLVQSADTDGKSNRKSLYEHRWETKGKPWRGSLTFAIYSDRESDIDKAKGLLQKRINEECTQSSTKS